MRRERPFVSLVCFCASFPVFSAPSASSCEDPLPQPDKIWDPVHRLFPPRSTIDAPRFANSILLEPIPTLSIIRSPSEACLRNPPPLLTAPRMLSGLEERAGEGQGRGGPFFTSALHFLAVFRHALRDFGLAHEFAPESEPFRERFRLSTLSL